LFNAHFKEISMSTAIATPSVASLAAPTDKQLMRLGQLGYAGVPATRSEASAIITRLLAQRDMQPATTAQRGRAGVLGVREVSTQIALLEALALWDAAAEDDAEAINTAVETLVARVRERFCRPVTVTVR
jgi:hypothetical protein